MGGQGRGGRKAQESECVFVGVCAQSGEGLTAEQGHVAMKGWRIQRGQGEEGCAAGNRPGAPSGDSTGSAVPLRPAAFPVALGACALPRPAFRTRPLSKAMPRRARPHARQALTCRTPRATPAWAPPLPPPLPRPRRPCRRPSRPRPSSSCSGRSCSGQAGSPAQRVRLQTARCCLLQRRYHHRRLPLAWAAPVCTCPAAPWPAPRTARGRFRRRPPPGARFPARPARRT